MMRNITSADNLLALVRNAEPPATLQHQLPPDYSVNAVAPVSFPQPPHPGHGVLVSPLAMLKAIHSAPAVGQSMRTARVVVPPANPILYPISTLPDPTRAMVDVHGFNNGAHSLDLAETFAYVEPQASPSPAPRQASPSPPPLVPQHHQTGSEDTAQALPGAPTEPPSVPHHAPHPGQGSDAPRRPTRQAAQRAVATLSRRLSRASEGRRAASLDSGIDSDAESEMDDGCGSDSDGDSGAGVGVVEARSAGAASAAPSHRASPSARTSKGHSRPNKRKTYDKMIEPGLPVEEVRRMRRVLSNRESARRSRKRRQEEMSGLAGELAEAQARSEALQAQLDAAVQSARSAQVDRDRLAVQVAQLQAVLQLHSGQQLHLTTTTCD